MPGLRRLKTALKIDQYSFGRMTVNGKAFTSDLILFPDGSVQDGWRRLEGHKLLPDDIQVLLKTKPQRLIIGTGASGLMAVSDQVIRLCRSQGIEVECLPTEEAAARFNEISGGDESLAACFHLTC